MPINIKKTQKKIINESLPARIHTQIAGREKKHATKRTTKGKCKKDNQVFSARVGI